MPQRTVNIGLAGFGTIGTGVVRRLLNPAEIENSSGVKLNLKKIVDLRIHKKIEIDEKIFSKNINDILDDPEIDIFVELIGGYNPAYDFIKKALEKGKHVVTANKAVIDKYGKELLKIAKRNRAYLMFGASVGGAIPIIDSLRIGLIGNNTKSIYGILNGTTNYILTKMSQGKSYDEALKEAQQKGFAEADPSFDVEGKDAAQKLAIVSSIAFGSNVQSNQIHTEGITKITKEDIAFASELGYVIKLLAIAKKDGKLELRVHPTIIPKTHPLASINNEINAVLFSGAADITMSGQGAGAEPTAGAVLSDIANIARRMAVKFKPMVNLGKGKAKIKNMNKISSKYYIRFSALDKPGTLAELSRIMGQEKINIAQVMQMGLSRGKKVPVVVMTDIANEGDMNKALKRLKKSNKVEAEVVIRAEI